jgi:acetylglutamate kinase
VITENGYPTIEKGGTDPLDDPDRIAYLRNHIAAVGKAIADGWISEGMIPKTQACLQALEGGAGKTHIIDGWVAHALLLELFTDLGIGTEILR